MKRLLAMLLMLPALAWGHGMLVGSAPMQGAVMKTPPHQIRLKFSEALEPALVKLRLEKEGALVELGTAPEVSKDSKRLTQKVGELPPGKYVIIWDVVSRDSHRTQGEIHFRVGGP